MISLAILGARVVSSIMFMALGAATLAGDESMVSMFEAIGFEPWGRLAIGAVEIAAGVGLLVPRTVAVSAYALCFVSFCALLAHLVTGLGNPAGAIVLGLTTAVLTWTHRNQLPAFEEHPERRLQ
jgi:uncharacterized membrane protein